MELKFYRCAICGNIAVKVNDSGVSMVCCDEEMTELAANTDDKVATEKHVPITTVDGSSAKVVVGEVEHPMIKEHFIEWIAIATSTGWQIKFLKSGEEPEAKFELADDETMTAVYEYCNLHSLWKGEV